MITVLAILAVVVLLLIVGVTIHGVIHGCFLSQLSLFTGGVGSVLEVVGLLIAGIFSGFSE